MGFFGEFVGENGQPEAPSFFALLAARASCAALVVGPLNATGGLNRSQAHSLDMAILVVGLPPVFFFIGIFYFIYRRRQTWRSQPDAKSSADPDSTGS